MRHFVEPLPLPLVKTIVVTNNHGATIYQHSVEIKLEVGDLVWSKFDGVRLRVFKGSNRLDHWVEHYDPTNSNATIWVRIPEFPVGTTVLTMEYGSGVPIPCPRTHIPIFKRPSNVEQPRQLDTFPKRTDGTNLVTVHPCVIAAQGWTRFSTPGVQDVSTLLVDTPWDSTDLPTGWDLKTVELPALWVQKNGKWVWPTGVESWSQSEIGADNYSHAVSRWHPILFPIGTVSNALVAPSCDPDDPSVDMISWADPHMVWIEATQTLRVYFRYNTPEYCLYYKNITSTNGSWSGATLGGTYKCQVSGVGDFNYANTLDSPTYDGSMSPSVFLDGSDYWLLQTQKNAATGAWSLQRWKGVDGKNWVRQADAVVGMPIGLDQLCWHLGVCPTGADEWVMLTGSGTARDAVTWEPTMVLMWTSVDKGATWELQLPKVLAHHEYATTRSEWRSPYRPCPCYVDGVGLYVACGFAYYSGSTLISLDSTWRPGCLRPCPAINMVFWRGAWDAADLVVENSLGILGQHWPDGAWFTRNSGLVYSLSGGELRWSDPSYAYNSLELCTDCPEHYHLRCRYRTTDPDVTNINLTRNVGGLFDGDASGPGTNAVVCWRADTNTDPTAGLIYADSGRLADIARTVDLRIAYADATHNSLDMKILDRIANTVIAGTSATMDRPSSFANGTANQQWRTPLYFNPAGAGRELAFQFAFFREGLPVAEETSVEVFLGHDWRRD